MERLAIRSFMGEGVERRGLSKRTVAVLVRDAASLFELGVTAEVFGIDRTHVGLPPVDYRVCAEAGPGPVPTKHRAGLAVTALIVPVAWFALVVNGASAWLALAAILLYVVFYTIVLKRRTAQNIVWGGIAGCLLTHEGRVVHGPTAERL